MDSVLLLLLTALPREMKMMPQHALMKCQFNAMVSISFIFFIYVPK